MSFAFSVTVMLILGSSAVIGFVLNPTKGEPTPSDSAVTHRRFHVSSLQSIRKLLLTALNLQTEPRLPAEGADHVRKMWLRVEDSTPQLPGNLPAPASAAPLDVGNNTSPKCCSSSSEILMTDLGWDSWVILPKSVTIVECAICIPESGTMCPLSSVTMPCCQPTSQEMVPFLYIDNTATIVLSSMQLTRSCSCEPGNLQATGKE